MPLPAPRYWQTRHQHALASSGASEIENRIALHKQPPDTVIGSPEGRFIKAAEFPGVELGEFA
ncbi:MAG: hypothetical protein WCB71_02470, partial [Aestuariivirga sp.]